MEGAVVVVVGGFEGEGVWDEDGWVGRAETVARVVRERARRGLERDGIEWWNEDASVEAGGVFSLNSMRPPASRFVCGYAGGGGGFSGALSLTSCVSFGTSAIS